MLHGSFVMTDLFNFCLSFWLYGSHEAESAFHEAHTFHRRGPDSIERQIQNLESGLSKCFFCIRSLSWCMCLGTSAVAKVTGTDKEGLRIPPFSAVKILPPLIFSQEVCFHCRRFLPFCKILEEGHHRFLALWQWWSKYTTKTRAAFFAIPQFIKSDIWCSP